MSHQEDDMGYPARWWHPTDDGRLQCDLCPRNCALRDGQRGLCFVRQRVEARLVLTTYGRSSGFCIDPIEKKPLYHFHPGSAVLSFGTAGCNLACKFCQNWEISRSREMERLADRASPEAIARSASQHGCKSVAFTYNDPVIFAEYAMDVADACHALGISTVAVTAGYVHAAPRREFFAKIDAANVDLKAFTEQFYKSLTSAELEPVKETLRYLVHETRVWTEITTLLIPGHNDSDHEIGALSEWIARDLGVEVPLHFTAFHPEHRMRDLPPTPAATLRRAREIAARAGLSFVYTGNVRDVSGGTTVCAACGASVVVRDGYRILRCGIDAQGHCEVCKAPLPGRYSSFVGALGPRRIPVVVGA